jgi:pimeloyl-ACP methyl ester carboxylesterase
VTAPPAWFTAALAVPASDELVDVAGARIAYRAWGDAGRPGVVLVHGTAAHAHWWDHVAPFLADAGLRVAALSISGHGDSGWRERYSFDQWAAEVMAVASAAGIAGPPVIIGHSLGGHIALQAASRYGRALTGIVVVDAPMFEGMPPPEAATQSAGFGSSRSPAGRTYPSQEAILDRFRLIPEQPVLPYVREYVAVRSVTAREDGSWGWKFDQGVFMKMAPRSRFPGAETEPIRCQGAVLRAQQGIMAAPMAGRLRARFDHPVPIVELPVAGHHVMLDEPLTLVTALRTILAGWAAPEPSAPERPSPVTAIS